ncbi:putative NIP7-required for efficient 60S ribosome subunit biogenesis [Jaminaea rosea]|uniref:60S ribosome subunit biogenesis protein NIP7 n=1 Tax=Jaminaea rosea TaxID=1569628 RepID=A0A316UL47_9BASI|nr:putative NIP7-required for efficient 60S ribosome subunit biogenesis [Jaminaea rosea]PWN26006.1 putative NIP7-required for efficient 60S ribosome subunit biogenesis [Jaminaea rosea]
MRPLTDDETRLVFSKLAHYIGNNVVHLVDSTGEASSSSRAHENDDDDASEGKGQFVFRLHRDRVYYVDEMAMKLAGAVSREKLCSLGTCLGKFSKSGNKFRLHITALDYLSTYAKHKVWIKPNGELPFLYGGHVVKAHLGRITDDTPEHAGVVVLSMSGTPLGFGVTARSTVDTRKLDPTSIIVFHQADVGEYLRDEDTLF